MATISVLVPAAGCGARAALNGNKILAPLHRKPLLWWTLRALCSQTVFTRSSTRSENASAKIIEIVVSVRDEEREIVSAIFSDIETDLPLKLAPGGQTRAASVFEAAKIARGDFVLVHDAARPCLTNEITERVVLAALQHSSAIAALAADDTVKRVSLSNETVQIEETLDRSRIFLAQTPQMFRRETLRDAFENAFDESWTGTDCASYVERWFQSNRVLDNAECESVHIVCGDFRNLKVTYAHDLELAESWIES